MKGLVSTIAIRPQALLVATYLGAIVGAELVTVLVAPLWGIIFHFAILFSLILNSVLVDKYFSHLWLLHQYHRFSTLRNKSSVHVNTYGQLFLALGLVSLIRIVNIGMPLAEFSPVYRYILMSIPIFIGIVSVIMASGFSHKEVGLTINAMPIQILVAITGACFGFIGYLILEPEPLVSALTWQEIIVPALILLVATGFVEELAFRGVIQRSAWAVGSWEWIYVAVIFSSLQICQWSVQHWAFAFLVAIFFGWVVKRTGSILGVSLCHGILNICLYLVYPFLY